MKDWGNVRKDFRAMSGVLTKGDPVPPEVATRAATAVFVVLEVMYADGLPKHAADMIVFGERARAFEGKTPGDPSRGLFVLAAAYDSRGNYEKAVEVQSAALGAGIREKVGPGKRKELERVLEEYRKKLRLLRVGPIPGGERLPGAGRLISTGFLVPL